MFQQQEKRKQKSVTKNGVPEDGTESANYKAGHSPDAKVKPSSKLIAGELIKTESCWKTKKSYW